MQVISELIYIKWDGPFSLDEVELFTDETDFGIYQIYGDHIVYGRDVLLYIGKAERRKFSQRISEQTWHLENNIGTVRVYRGRFAGDVRPLDDKWNNQIDLAERLLIYAHFPAYNSQKDFGRYPGLKNVHIVNLGHYRSLLPEISGTRWAETNSLPSNYPVFNARDIPPEATNNALQPTATAPNAHS